MGKTDLGDYKNIYLQTAKEYVDKMLVSLGKLANDVLDEDALNNLHISSHSLKSQSQVMGYAYIASLSAVIEKISKAALEEGHQINNDLIPVLKESAEALSLCLSQIEKENKEKDLSEFVNKLETMSKAV